MIAGTRKPFALACAFLAVAIVMAWMSGSGRSFNDLGAPLNYSGDALAVLAQAKAYSTGEILPLLPKDVASLGAPFGANWTDYPAEDFIFFVAGLLSLPAGLFAGTTLLVLGLHILAGIAFLLAASALGYRTAIGMACAFLFAIAPYGFFRGLGHLTLTAYWHVPLALLAIAWAAGAVPPRADGWSAAALRNLALASALVAGILNPYYLAVFLFLGACVLAGAVAARHRRNAIAAASLLAVAVLAFIVQSLDSIWMNAAYGSNPEAVTRNFGGLDQYGLRLPDLVFPVLHRFASFQQWATETYQAVAPGGGIGRGESVTAYIGLVGVGALALMLAGGTIRVASRQFEQVSTWFWMALGTIGLGIVGGINYLLGAFGFVMLRATNRFSIVLLAIALLWLCEVVSRRTRRGGTVLVALALGVVGLMDLPPAGVVVPAAETRAKVEADARFTGALEAALPPRAMVLQLPIKAFPETGVVGRMEDYEHFRPYLHSKALRFSYGTLKGRSDSQWQSELLALPAPELAARAARYGFAAIYVNRRAYADGAKELESNLAATLGAPIADSEELVAYRLGPSPAPPVLPPLLPREIPRGFWPTETDGQHAWAWAKVQAPILVLSVPRGAQPGRAYEAYFELDPGFGGDAEVTLDDVPQGTVRKGEGIRRIVVALPPDRSRWTIRIRSANLPVLPGNGDPRALGARVMDMRVREVPAVGAKP